MDLSEAELSYLESVTRKGKHKARTITRALILIMANEGHPDKAIASNLRVNISTVERTREKFVVGGLEYGIKDRPHPRKPRKLDGKPEAFLIATACSTPPDGRTRWTMQLLAERLVSVLSRQCLERRIPEVQILKSEIVAWEQQRNKERATVNWRFKTTDARNKLGRFYPPI